MGVPQIIFIVLLSMQLGMAIAKHGEPRLPYHAGWAVANIILVTGLLYWGGFFG